jgi:hypothetical protein
MASSRPEPYEATSAEKPIAGVAKTDMAWVQHYPLLRAKLQ